MESHMVQDKTYGSSIMGAHSPDNRPLPGDDRQPGLRHRQWAISELKGYPENNIPSGSKPDNQISFSEHPRSEVTEKTGDDDAPKQEEQGGFSKCIQERFKCVTQNTQLFFSMPLWHYIYTGDLNGALRVIKLGAEMNLVLDNEGRIPLNLAIYNRFASGPRNLRSNPPMVQLLMDNGANPLFTTKYKNCYGRDVNTFSPYNWFLHYIDLMDEINRSLITEYIFDARDEKGQYWIKPEEYNTYLIDLMAYPWHISKFEVTSGLLNKMKERVEHFDLNLATRPKEQSPFYKAILTGNPEAVSLMLRYNANPTKPWADGEYPLDLAKKRFDEVTDKLLSGKKKVIHLTSLLDQQKGYLGSKPEGTECYMNNISDQIEEEIERCNKVIIMNKNIQARREKIVSLIDKAVIEWGLTDMNEALKQQILMPMESLRLNEK